MTQNSSAGVVTPPTKASTSTAAAVLRNGKIRLGNPETLLGVIPHLLGFVPTDSLVVIGADSPHGQIELTLRYDLPDPPDEQVARHIAAHAVGVLAAQRVNCAIAIGYGPARLVAPLGDALREQARLSGLALAELLRAEDGRYWSYLCEKPECCPPEGKPYETQANAEFATREDLVATLAPLTGQPRQGASKATRKAEERAAKLIARVSRSKSTKPSTRLIATAGIQSVTQAIGTYRDGRRIADADKIAWLCVVLRDLRVRDDAWARMDPEHRERHLLMWTDLTRNARPGYVAAPAALLAFVAWQCGNGALANVALDRALADQPGYSMAILLRQAITSGIPPSAARLPMTPEEVAASYDDIDE
jgi:hypothetical protein